MVAWSSPGSSSSSGWRAAVTIAAIPVAMVGGALAIQMCKGAYLRWQYRKIPGPPPKLIFGNMLDVFKYGGSHTAIFHWRKQYGKVFKMVMMSAPMVVVSEAEEARSLCFSSSNHAVMTVVPPKPARAIAGTSPLLDGRGLVQARDGYWRFVRNAWQPAFAPGSLKRYTVLMEQSAQQLCDALSNLVVSDGATDQQGDTSGYVDIHELLMNTTLETVGTCAYGVRFHALPGPAQDTQADSLAHAAGKALSNSVKVFFQSVTLRTGSSYMFAIAIVPPLAWLVVPIAKMFPDKPLVRVRKAAGTIRDTAARLIGNWRDAHSAQATPAPTKATVNGNGDRALPAGSMSGIDPGSFLGLMLSAQDKARAKMQAGGGKEAATPAKPVISPLLPTDASGFLDDGAITAQANTFILAGTETTAAALTFAVYMLCQHPEAEKRLAAEIESLPWTAQGLAQDAKTPFTDAVINEVMRLNPPAHATSRDAGPHGCKAGGYDVPPNGTVLIAIYSLHRDPDYWPRAEEFLPERWLPENEKALGPTTPSAYMPFGAGTRQCPGYKFALQEARLALIYLYKHFTFSMAPGQVPLSVTAGISLTPMKGLKVRVKRRVAEHKVKLPTQATTVGAIAAPAAPVAAA